jgi:hypothetical protein
MRERISVEAETSRRSTPSLTIEDAGGSSGEDWPGVA